MEHSMEPSMEYALVPQDLSSTAPVVRTEQSDLVPRVPSTHPGSVSGNPTYLYIANPRTRKYHALHPPSTWKPLDGQFDRASLLPAYNQLRTNYGYPPFSASSHENMLQPTDYPHSQSPEYSDRILDFYRKHLSKSRRSADPSPYHDSDTAKISAILLTNSVWFSSFLRSKSKGFKTTNLQQFLLVYPFLPCLTFDSYTFDTYPGHLTMVGSVPTSILLDVHSLTNLPFGLPRLDIRYFPDDYFVYTKQYSIALTQFLELTTDLGSRLHPDLSPAQSAILVWYFLWIACVQQVLSVDNLTVIAALSSF